MTDSNRDKKGDIPTDSDELAIDAEVNEGGKSKKEDPSDETVDRHAQPNPPRTTTGKFFTAPKFGSAGSGGLEIEPGLDTD
ncbi:MAG TPA: hypothetical protein VK529_04920 [Gemmatimonadaceae bacterium]|jgi:hypothetical protein|nr:hypothetical protein [Gemmatimonadaceae bacterium]